MKTTRKLLAALLAAALLLTALPFTASAAGENLWSSAMKLDNLALTATAEGSHFDVPLVGELMCGAKNVNDGDLVTVWRSGNKGTSDDNAVLTFHWDEMQEIASVSIIWVAYYPDLPDTLLDKDEHNGYTIEVTKDGVWTEVGIVSATRTELASYIEELTPEQTQGVDMSMFSDVCLDIDLFGAQKTKDLRIICKDPAIGETEDGPVAKEYPMANEIYFFDNDIWTLALNYQLGREEFPVDENGKLTGYYSVGKELAFPETVISVGTAFSDKKIETITVPATLTGGIRSDAFASLPNLKEFVVDEQNPTYTAENGVLYNKDKTALLCYPAAKTGDSFTVPSTVNTIADYAFANAKVKTITLPEGLTSIGTSAFAGSALTEVSIPAGVPYLRANTFAACADLTEVTLAEGVKEIGVLAFNGCGKLATVNLPKSLEIVGNNAFNGCKAIATCNYAGTDTEWDEIDFGLGNAPLLLLKGSVIGEVDYTSEVIAVTSDSVVDNRTDLADTLACDGDLSTRWQSGATCKDGNNGWLAFEWAEEHTFTRQEIKWEAMRAKQDGYTIQSSDDGTSWTNIPMTNTRKDIGDNCVLDEVTFKNPVTTKYLRIYITGMQNGKNNPSIFEMTCFGEGLTVEEPTDVDHTASEGLVYTLENDHYVLTGIGTCTDTAIVVSSRYEGKPVTDVAAGAFKDLTTVTSIRFNEGIQNIAAGAIAGCTALEKVGLPSSLVSVSAEAISGSGITVLTDTALTTLEAKLDLGTEDDPAAFVFTDDLTVDEYTRIPAEKKAQAVKGDVDGNKDVDASDLTVLARHVGKIEEITDAKLLKNADVDGVAGVDANDLTKLARFVGKIDTTL